MPTARRMFGEEFTHVVDCQHAEHPDLRGYRREAHRAVLLDEVASPQFVADNKKVLQAHVDGAKLGQSATQLYVYSVMLWRTPIILTTNKWNLADLDAEDQEWIRANCVAVAVNDPVWLEPADPAAPAPENVPIPNFARRRELGAGDAPPPPSPPRRWGRRPAEDRAGPSPEHKRIMI